MMRPVWGMRGRGWGMGGALGCESLWPLILDGREWEW